MTIIELLKDHWTFLTAGLLWPIFWYSIKNTFVDKSEFDGFKRRITTLESKVDQLPSQKDIAELAQGITELCGDIKAINTDLTHVKKSVDMLVQVEMRGKNQ